MNIGLKKILAPIVKSYHIDDIISALEEVCSERADELVDLHHTSTHEAKALTRVSWHLRLIKE